MKVHLFYSAFNHTMSIYIDGQPISHVSKLTKYQSRPFETWCEEICDAIADEVNGRFDLIYTGRSCEARILGQFARNNSQCMNFRSEAPQIPESAVIRLKRLSSLVQSGLQCPRFSYDLLLYTDGDPEEIKEIISKGIPKLSFCKVRLQIHSVSDLPNHCQDKPIYILLVNEFRTNTLHLESRNITRGVIVCSDGKFEPLKTENGCFAEHMEPQNSLMILEQYFELWAYADILGKALAGIQIKESDPSYLQVMALDKQEPVAQVVLPSSIEYGQTAPIKIRMIPAGAKDENISYRISDESVVVLTSQGLKAVGVGEVVVEAYKAGQTVKIASQKITCYRRNRIQTIHLSVPQADMLVGDRIPLSYSYLPEDADDVSKVRLVSSNGTVAAPDGGLFILARAPGSCTVRVQAEQAAAACQVRVYPRIAELIPNLPAITAEVGEVVRLNIERSPSNATLQKIKYYVTPPSLGRYDPGLKGFYAENSGDGELIVATEDGCVKKTIPINVTPVKVKTPRWLLIALAAAVILILYIILKGA